MAWTVEFDWRTVGGCLLVKFLLGGALLLAFNGFKVGPGFRILESGDTPGYLEPVENLLAHGTWSVAPGNPRLLAVRPPAYGLVYLPLRLAASRRVAELLLLCLQLSVAALACIAFGRTLAILSGSPTAGWAALVMALFSFELLVYDLRLLTESFAVSGTMVANYLIVKDGFRDLRRSLLVGLLLMGVIFLRPFMGVIFVGIGLGLVLSRRRPAGDALPHVAAVALPFFAACAAWTAFNCPRLGGRVIFMQDSLGGTYFADYRPYTRYLRSWGGDLIYWNKGSAAGWFEGRSHARDVTFPPVVFQGMDCGPSTVTAARDLMVEAGLKLGSPQYARATEMLNRCSDEFQRKHPFQARFVAPWRVLARYVRFAHGDAYATTNFYAKTPLLRVFHHVSAALCRALFLLGLFSYFLAREVGKSRFLGAYGVMLSAALLHLVVVCCIFRLPEGRYAVMTLWSVYPWGLWVLHERLRLAPWWNRATSSDQSSGVSTSTATSVGTS